MSLFLNKNLALLSNVLRSRSTFLKRTLSTTRRLSADFQQEGIPGSNLPFSIKNRYKLALMFALFFSPPLNAPFLIMRRQLLLNQGGGDGGASVEGQTLTTLVCPDNTGNEKSKLLLNQGDENASALGQTLAISECSGNTSNETGEEED